MRNSYLNKLYTVPLLLVVALGNGCGGGGSSDNSTAASTSAQSVLLLSPSPATVAPNGSVTLFPSGGVPPYSYLILNSFGTVTVNNSGISAVYHAPATAGTAQIEILDAANNSGLFQVSVTGTSTGGLTILPLNTTVPAGGTVTFQIVSGGTAPFVYSVLTANGGSFNANIYHAPSPTVAESVTIQISDSTGLSTQTSVFVQAVTGGTTTSCEGNFNATIAGAPATFTMIEDSSGRVAGDLSIQGYFYPLSGTCSASGGTITFSNLVTGSNYTGTVGFSGAVTTMNGTFITTSGTTYPWSATSH